MHSKTALVLFLIIILAACRGDEEPLPTTISLDTAVVTAGLPSDADRAATQTALVPTVFFTPTVMPTSTDTFTPVPTDTLIPTATETLSAIRQTEVYISLRLTSVAGTSTAQVPPTATFTPRPTNTPTITPTPSDTPLPTVPLPDVPTPNRIIFTSNRAGSDDIWLMQLDGSDPRPLILLPQSDEITASCSPSGEQFAFDSDQNGDGREIYLGYYDGTPPRPLTDTGGENFHPVWSPLGDRIAFVSTREGNSDIWLMDNGGGNAQRITEADAADIMPQWSPNGENLYYASNREGQFEIYQYDLVAQVENRITFTEDTDEIAPALGYDLQTLAYIANVDPEDSTTAALWTTDFRSEGKPIITAAGRVDAPAWIERDKLLLAADLGGVTQIMLVDLRETTQSILTNLGPVNIWPRPCYVANEQITALLPTGVPPTPTPTATPELITVYTAVVNPGADWGTVTVNWTSEKLADIAPDDYRLGDAAVTIEDDLLIYTWIDNEQNSYALTLALEGLDGALDVTIVGYTLNGLPDDRAAVQDLAFIVRENILLESIPEGLYRLDDVDFGRQSIAFTFRIPVD